MIPETPKIDSRTAKELYDQALNLAKVYCPEWNPSADEFGSVLLKLCARLGEIVIGQMNRIPEKQLLAFYDFIGMDHLPAMVSKVPLTFKLAKGGQEAMVPIRTRVVSAADPGVVFETLETLAAVNFKIKTAYSVNPWTNRHTVHYEDYRMIGSNLTIFGGDKTEKAIERIFYLADRVFDFKNPADITIKLSFNNKKAEVIDYFTRCFSDAGEFTLKTVAWDQTQKILTISIEKSLIPLVTINNTSDHWIWFRQDIPALVATNATIPEITGIVCDLTVYDLYPDALFFNDTPLDPKKGFYPFGENPVTGNAFYIACNEAFSRGEIFEDATIAIKFNFKKGTKYGNLKLQWEYWNGSKWEIFTPSSDTIEKFLKPASDDKPDGVVTFACPEIKTTTLNGIASRWIRVRITDGGYGKPGEYVQSNVETIIDDILPAAESNLTDKIKKLKEKLASVGISSGYTYIPPSFDPPFISAITIDYKVTEKPIDKYKIYHNFESRDGLIKQGAFNPFPPLPEKNPSFYMGFEEELANKSLALYFSLEPRLYGVQLSEISMPGNTETSALSRIAGYTWQYFNGAEWKVLLAADETDFLTKNGIARLNIPFNIAKQKLFGQELYWLKLELTDGTWFVPPIIRGIFPNTVWAENAMMIQNERLGSSNGQPTQVFQFSRRSLLQNQIIEIKEQSLPSGSELEILTLEEGPDALRTVANKSGDIEEIWVRWHEVKTFLASDSLSRHYLIDRENGQLIFGDGVQGMIPPALPNNIYAREYKSGGGKKGNQKEMAVTGLKTTIPNIESVTNADAANGGRELESITDVVRRAPHFLKSNDRAITREDFEWLAMEASQEVSRAKCIPEKEENCIKKIIVVIAPDYEDGCLYPETGLLDLVETHLKAKAFAGIREIIEVAGPGYQKINVQVEIKVKEASLSETAIIIDTIKWRLAEYFSPIKGGPDGNGWKFGQMIHRSETAAIIGGVAGVDSISSLIITKEEMGPAAAETIRMNIPLAENELPCAGVITVNIAGGVD